MKSRFLVRLLPVVCLASPLAAVGSPVTEPPTDTTPSHSSANQGIEFFLQPSMGISRMFWGRAGTTSPKAVEDVDDQLLTGGLVTIEAGVVGRERGLGLAAFYELHTRSASVDDPFDHSQSLAETQTPGTWTDTYRKFEPSLQVHAVGLEVIQHFDIGSPDLQWTATFGVAYLNSRLEVSYERFEAGTDEPSVSRSYDQTGEGSALIVGSGFLWRVGPHVALATGIRYMVGRTTTNELTSYRPLLGVSDQRVDHLGLTLGARFSL